jgi:hypothetical protein
MPKVQSFYRQRPGGKWAFLFNGKNYGGKMSGGSLCYGQDKIEEIVYNIQHASKDPLHLAFAKHLRVCGEAVHALEWMLSGDTRPGAEIEAIRKALPTQCELESAIESAQEALFNLKDILKIAVKKRDI